MGNIKSTNNNTNSNNRETNKLKLSKKLYLNLSELKSDDRSLTTKKSTNVAESITLSDEYTSLNEIGDVINIIETQQNNEKVSQTQPTLTNNYDNYATLDLNNYSSLVMTIKKTTNCQQSFESDSQLYSNIKLINQHETSSKSIRTPPSNSLIECHKKFNNNFTNIHLLTTSLLSKLSKSVKKHKNKRPETTTLTTIINTTNSNNNNNNNTNSQQKMDFILILPPQKFFDPSKEFNVYEEDENVSTSETTNTTHSSISDTSEMIFYQTSQENNKKYNEGDYDYLASYEWPLSQAAPPLPPASTQPNRNQAILKFYDYY